MDETSAHKYLKRQFATKNSNVLLGIGDDSSVLKLNPGKVILASSDTLVENVHFLKEKITPFQIGQKAVAVTVSDISAMGGVPIFILSSIGIEKDCFKIIFKNIMNGIKSACKEFDVELVGGNLSQSETFFIDITAIGEINPEKIIKRSGAKSGDKIYVTGSIGDSALGLMFLNKKDATENTEFLINRHIKPMPRLKIGSLLGEKAIPSSMIDISDGLIIDLSRITTDFNIGAEVELEKIPLSRDYLSHYQQFCDDKYSLALSGGEDYELLFTAHPEKIEEIQKISLNTGIKISEIGTVTESQNIKFIETSGIIKNYNSKGFIHFN
ncbi:MAG: thiamine-phosphate kinase [Thermodesulfobacteriota bacterium]